MLRRIFYLSYGSLLGSVFWFLSGVERALAVGLPAGQCIECAEQGPSVVIITNMSARPGASPSLLLGGFALVAVLFGLAWLARRGDIS